MYLCTGRNYNMLSPLLKYNFDGVIASSGAYVRAGKEVIYDCPMDNEQKNELIERLHGKGIFTTIECFDGAYTDEGFKEFLEAHAQEGSNSELLRWRRQIEGSLNIQPMSAYSNQPVYKIIIMMTNIEQLEDIRSCYQKNLHFVIQEQDRFGIINGEIIRRDYDKGRAVNMVCEHLGIPIEDSVAYGDSMNDLEMMEAAGYSVCMSNGSEALKNKADEICESVTDNGIYKSFYRNGLI